MPFAAAAHPSSLRADANKQWSGPVADFYRRRYVAYAARAADAISRGHPGAINATGYTEDLAGISADFTLATAPASVYPSTPVGDAITLATQLYNKYAAASGGGGAAARR